MTLPGGAGSVTYEGTREWANFQVVQQPAGGWALGGALTAIFGLAASLFIQRRRVWVRAVRGADGVTVVEMAGLGRSETTKVPEELGDLAGILYDRTPATPDDETTADAGAAAGEAEREPDGESEAVVPVSGDDGEPVVPGSVASAAGADAATVGEEAAVPVSGDDRKSAVPGSVAPGSAADGGPEPDDESDSAAPSSGSDQESAVPESRAPAPAADAASEVRGGKRSAGAPSGVDAETVAESPAADPVPEPGAEKTTPDPKVVPAEGAEQQ
jgi:cytochrome c biogenesis protein